MCTGFKYCHSAVLKPYALLHSLRHSAREKQLNRLVPPAERHFPVTSQLGVPLDLAGVVQWIPPPRGGRWGAGGLPRLGTADQPTSGASGSKIPQGHRPVRSVDGSSAPSDPANPSPLYPCTPNTHHPVPPIPLTPPNPVLPRLLSELTPTPGMKGSWRLSPTPRGSVVAVGQHTSLAWISGREEVLSEAPH